MRETLCFCCVCVQKVDELSGLYSTDYNNVKYIEKLKLCMPKETWEENYHICRSCIKQLDAAYDFVQVCLKSELFRKENLSHSCISNIKEKFRNDSIDLFYCDSCNKSFRQKKYLSQHITKLHTNRHKREDIKRLIKNESDVVKCKLEVTSQEINSIEVKAKIEQIGFKDQNTLVKNEGDRGDNKNDLKEDEKYDINDGTCNRNDTDNIGENTDIGDIENDENFGVESGDDEKSKIKIASSKRGLKLKGPLKCNFCEEVFHKRHLWSSHIRSKHTFEKPFSCEECDARYMNAYSLLIHKRKHNNEKPFICAQCGKSFVSSADLNHHNKIHNTCRAYPCPMCDRSYKTHSNLRTHRLQMHLDPAEWKFPCNLCDKKFPIKGNLVKHLKRHAGIKEFSCHVCGKKFINKAELNLHLNTHTNQRLFNCGFCSKEYKNREGLRRHMKVVHDMGNWKAPRTDKKYLCPMCPKIFAFTNKLQRHIFTHTGEKPYKCDYCGKRFIDNYGRKVHLRKDHNMEIPA